MVFTLQGSQKTLYMCCIVVDKVSREPLSEIQFEQNGKKGKSEGARSLENPGGGIQDLARVCGEPLNPRSTKGLFASPKQ
jgi:hypothetical protein